jgi:putative aldouronate transport system substrate-binding protein
VAQRRTANDTRRRWPNKMAAAALIYSAAGSRMNGGTEVAYTRRAFIRGSGLLVGGGALLSACAPAPASTAPTPAPVPTAAATPTSASVAAPTAVPAPTLASTASTSAGAGGVRFAGVTLPSFVAFVGGVSPDLPSSGPNISDAYVSYPKDAPKANGEAPGRGGEVTTHVGAYYPPSTPLDQNPAWQEVNRQLGLTVRMSPISLTDLFTKTATMIAADNLPDLMSFSQGWNASPNLPQFVEARCADLTSYLSGDAIRAYPNLAAIPTAAWKHTAYKGHLYAVPIHRPAVYTVLYCNSTVYEAEIGKDVVPKDATDFKKILQQLNRPQEGRYAYAAQVAPNALPWDLTNISRIFGAPNVWGLDSTGKLVQTRETEQFKASVGFARDIYAAGLYHPDTATFNSPIQMENAFLGSRAIFAPHNMAFYNSLWRRGLAASARLVPRVLPPFAADGNSKPVFFLGTRMITTTTMKKASADRVEELLRVLNWLAAPFGSQEDRLLSFGVPDIDYTLDDRGNPVPTDRGPADASYVPWRYISQRPYVIYDPDLPDYAATLHAVETTFGPIGIEDATFGLYSPTNASKGVQLNLTFYDGLSDIVQGRRPLSDYDGLVRDWVANGGEQIRSEYREALATSA